MLSFNDNAIGALEFTVIWEKDGVRHEEIFLGRKFNAVNDIFPRGMRKALEGKKAGESVTITYEPRMCIPRFKDKLVRTFPLHQLRKKTIQGKPIVPRVGRFYPQGHIDGLRDIYPDTLTPFRLIGLDEEVFVADRNHPLANIPVTIKAKVQYIEERDTGTYGSLTHWRETTCDWGPGMQAMHEGQPTDFFLPTFFDTHSSDKNQFSPPKVDQTAQKNFEIIYNRFLTAKKRILELGHTADVQPEGEYDAALCTLGVEYWTSPVDTLKTINQHLKRGAPILIGFSNHYDSTRVIRGWTELHEFERMGLVLEYLRQAGLDGKAGTVSMRNDWRDKDDPLFLETRGVSDPVYVVYGHKK